MRRTRMLAAGTIMIATMAVSVADAASMTHPVAYTTTTTLSTEGIAGPNVVSLSGVESGSIYDPASATGQFPPIAAGPSGLFSFTLGSFQVSSPPAGTIARYDNTPFTITIRIGGSDPIVLNGALNGTVSGPDSFDLTGLIDTSRIPMIPNPFDSGSTDVARGLMVATGDLTSILIVPSAPLTIMPSSVNGGRTGLGAMVYPVPEPAAWVTFSIILAGLGGLRRPSWRRDGTCRRVKQDRRHNGSLN